MPRVALIISTVTFFAAPAAASADFVHTVSPGESLYSIAAADGLSVDQLAAANGVSPDAQLIAGTDLQIPPQGGVASTTSAASTGVTGTSGDGDGDSDDGVASTSAATTGSSGDGDADSDDGAGASSSGSGSSSSGSGAGSYVVQPGDTLSGIAARAGTSAADLAAANGLDLNAVLPAGAVLQLSGGGGGTSSSASSQPVGAAAQGSSGGGPYPTPETVTPSQVGSIAAANGVPPSLADAIAQQESGFNNDLVSSADARGVMQILPGTWNYINNTLVPGGSPLDPASATDNVRGGVLLLRSLLNSTGGDPAMAAAGYYQGLPSVQQNGLYSDTQQYVNNVMALKQQFGGG